MSHTILKKPNGKWAVWSTVVDDFILDDVTRGEITNYYVHIERTRIETKLNKIGRLGDEYPPRDIDYQSFVELREEMHGDEE